MSKELKIKVDAALDISIDQEQKVKDFFEALESLPKTIDVKLSFDGGETWNDEKVKMNLMQLIGQLYFDKKEKYTFTGERDEYGRPIYIEN